MSQSAEQLTGARTVAHSLAGILAALKELRLAEGNPCRELAMAHQGLEACQYWLAQQVLADAQGSPLAPPGQPSAA